MPSSELIGIATFVQGAGGGGGGSSLIDSNGSTLGAVPAIDTTKLCTADKLVYYSDGSNWRPFYNPGFPRLEGASDIEFEGANADPPESMTWDNQNSITVDNNNSIPSTLILTATANAVAVSCLYKAVPGAPNKTYAFQMRSSATADAIFTGSSILFGIAARSSSGKILAFWITGATAGSTMYVQRWTNSSSFSANVLSAQTITLDWTRPLVLAMTSDGTNLAFKWSTYYSGFQTSFTTVYTEAIATFLGTFDQFGIAIQRNTTGTAFYTFVDWIRIF